MIEEWKRISFATGYEVSNQGNIRSLDRVIFMKNGRKRFYKGQPIKHQINNRGYSTVDLKIGKPILIHRIVGSHFSNLDFFDSKQQINHIEGNKQNNFISNLEVCDCTYNNRYEYEVRGRVIHNKGISKFSKEDRKNIIERYNNGEYQKDIAKSYNSTQQTISDIVNFKGAYKE